MLTVKKEIQSRHNKTRWECLCDCGKKSHTYGVSLVSKEATSCGCKRASHGHTWKAGKRSVSPTYQSWMAMKFRCRPDVWTSKWYYDSGVRVCKRWDKFENFLEDMGKRPKGKTLDRYPVTRKIYSKRNCRWATPKEQIANRRVRYGEKKNFLKT